MRNKITLRKQTPPVLRRWRCTLTPVFVGMIALQSMGIQFVQAHVPAPVPVENYSDTPFPNGLFSRENPTGFEESSHSAGMALRSEQIEVSDKRRAEVMAQAKREQYFFSSDRFDSVTGINPRHALDLVYSSEGMMFSPRIPRTGLGNSVQTKPSWQITMRAKTLILDSEVTNLREPSAILVENERVSSSVAPGCVEWYVNMESEVKHGFTIEEPRNASTDSLTLTLSVKTNLRMEPDLYSDGFVFRNHLDRTKATYRNLHVFDRFGKELEARMTLRPSDVGGESIVFMHVRTSGASWPIEIDPGTVTQNEEIKASDGESGDRLGASSDGSGTVMITGAPGKGSGAAYIYEKDQDGTDEWGEQKILTIPTTENPREGDQFGKGVAVYVDGESGKTYAAVGAPGYGKAGAVFIFERNEGGDNNWGFVRKLEPEDGAEGDMFGCSVSLDGTTLGVGASAHGGTGAIYMFQRSDGVYAPLQKLVPSDHSGAAELGAAVDVAGDRVIGGAPGAYNNEGRAYLFERNIAVSVLFVATFILFSNHAAQGDRFGAAVVMTLFMLAIGGPGVTGWPGSEQLVGRGAVWVWTLAALFLAPVHFAVLWGKVANGLFGTSLALNEFNDLVVGATGAVAQFIGGVAFLFLFSALLNAFELPITILPTTFIEGGMALGTSLVLLGTVLFVMGAAYSADKGAFFRFTLAATAFTFVLWRQLFFPPAILINPALAALVAPLGDFDGDGIPNLLEFLMGLSPTVFDSNPLQILSAGGGKLVLLFQASLAVLNALLVLQYAAGISSWFLPGTGPLANLFEVRVRRAGISANLLAVTFVSAVAANAFFRLQARQVPQN